MWFTSRPVAVTCGKCHKTLAVILDHSVKGEVTIDMDH